MSFSSVVYFEKNCERTYMYLLINNLNRYIFTCLISSLISFSLHAQLNSKYCYFNEPEFTCGDSNVIFVKLSPVDQDSMIQHWMVKTMNADHQKIQDGGDTIEVFGFPTPKDPVNHIEPFKDGNKYGYYFKILASNKTELDRTPVTFSIQDLEPPNIKLSSTTPKLRYNKWLKTRDFSMNCIIQDFAGIQWSCLYHKTNSSKWQLIENSTINFNEREDDGIPDSVERNHTFQISEQEDNHYQYFIDAKDASYTPESHEGNYHFSGNERKPAKEDDIEKDIEISIDTIRPKSEITNTNKIVGSLTFNIYYQANDPVSSPHNVASGLEKIELFRIVGNETTLVAIDSGVSIDFQFTVTVNEEGTYTFFTVAYDSAGNEQANETIKIYTVSVDLTGPKGIDFNLKDLTTADDFASRIFKAESGWTNSLNINATIQVAESDLSDLDFIYFSGDVTPSTLRNVKNNQSVVLTLKQMKDLNYVYMQAQDFAGNKMQDSILKTICFDNVRPDFSLSSSNSEPSKKMIDPLLPKGTNNLYQIQLFPDYDINDTVAYYYAWIDGNSEEDKKPFKGSISLKFSHKDIKNGNNVKINVTLIDKAGNSSDNILKITVPPVNEFEFCNVPNPFNLKKDQETTFVLVADEGLNPVIIIYDAFGNLVKELIEHKPELSGDATYYLFPWDGSNEFKQRVSEGIYLAVCPAVTKERIKVLVINR